MESKSVYFGKDKMTESFVRKNCFAYHPTMIQKNVHPKTNLGENMNTNKDKINSLSCQ